MADEFKAITSQEEFDQLIKERLNRQRNSYEEEISKLKGENSNLLKKVEDLSNGLKDKEASDKSYKDQIEDLTGKVNSYEIKSLKTRIALENSIPYELAPRLEGDDEDQIRKDAEKLSKFLGRSDPVPPLKSTEEKNFNSEDSAYMELLKDLKGD